MENLPSNKIEELAERIANEYYNKSLSKLKPYEFNAVYNFAFEIFVESTADEIYRVFMNSHHEIAEVTPITSDAGHGDTFNSFMKDNVNKTFGAEKGRSGN